MGHSTLPASIATAMLAMGTTRRGLASSPREAIIIVAESSDASPMMSEGPMRMMSGVSSGFSRAVGASMVKDFSSMERAKRSAGKKLWRGGTCTAARVRSRGAW